MINYPDLEDAIEFAENPEPRCPCILLLDTSRSMHGAPIDALNEGVRVFRDELCKDPLASRRVEIAIVTFDDDIHYVQDFITADRFEPPTLTVKGFTCMGAAINSALNMLHQRKATYRASGVAYYRPWVLMITDGEPHGEPEHLVEEATRRIKEQEDSKRVAFFAVGVGNANMPRLAQIVARPPLKLQGLQFNDMFVWLSASMQRVSHAKMDDQIPLPPINVARPL